MGLNRKKLLDHLRTNVRSYAFFAAIYVAVVAECFFLSETIGDTSTAKLRWLLFSADVCVLFVFYWLVRPGLRWLTLPLIWIISIFILANVLYYRYWGDMFPIQSMFSAANYNSFVFDSIVPLWRAADFVFLVLPALVTLSYILLKPKNSPPFTKKNRLAAVLVSMVVFVFSFWGSADSTRRWQLISGQPAISLSDCIKHRYDAMSTQTDMWKNNGLTGYLIAQIINYPEAQAIELTDGQRQSIASFISKAAGKAAVDSCLSENRQKNLIFIIVESLNAWTVNKEYGGHRLTPVLSDLVAAPGTVSCLRMLSQINDGGSSDGQLIYNTGLLPLKRGVAVMTNIDNRYPSLVEALRAASSAEFIVENASVYNHRRSSRAFGYDTIYDSSSLIEAGFSTDLIGDDDAVLSFAFETISEMPQPFFAEITTLSMHYPFNIKGFEPVDWIDSVAHDDYYLSHYLQTVHYTDSAIGRFLTRLENSSLADNTIVVIASDHDEATRQRAGTDNPEDDSPIVFIALGSGKTMTLTDVPMSQADVFPTILDLMGIDGSEYSWRGLGRSILAPDRHRAAVSRTGRVEGAVTADEERFLRRAFEVSDSIIRSDYFAR